MTIPLAIAALVLLVGCGSDSETAWCPEVPEITTDASTDRTGKDNTYERVRTVHRRYADRILRRCPRVNGVGIGKLEPYERVDDPTLPPEQIRRRSNAQPDHTIEISLTSGKDRPKRPLFLEGVPLRVKVTGPIRAL